MDNIDKEKSQGLHGIQLTAYQRAQHILSQPSQRTAYASGFADGYTEAVRDMERDELKKKEGTACVVCGRRIERVDFCHECGQDKGGQKDGTI